MRTPALTLVLAACLAAASSAAAGDDALESGPLLGPVGARVALVWVQTTRPAAVQLRYAPATAPERARLTPPARTDSAGDCALTVTLEGLAPGTAYVYELFLDGALAPRPYPLTFTTQPARWKTSDVTLVTGSCANIERAPRDGPDKPTPRERERYGIFTSMAAAAQGADAVLWLGDNVYLRDGDAGSEAAISGRYRNDRALRELQPLFAAAPNYAIWDDHDFALNNSDGTFQLKAASLRVFERYWPNLARRGLPEAPGVFQRVRLGDVELFLLDDRYHRSPHRWPAGPDKRGLGAIQLAWLKAALVSSRATFKLIACGNQVLNRGTRYETMQDFPDEVAELVGWLTANRIEGVLFLSGDRHLTELIRHDRDDAYPLYELTCSPMTSEAFDFGEDHPEWQNPQRLEGTLVQVENFAVIEATGPRKDRRLVVDVRNRAGETLWLREFPRRDLGYPREPRSDYPGFFTAGEGSGLQRSEAALASTGERAALRKRRPPVLGAPGGTSRREVLPAGPSFTTKVVNHQGRGPDPGRNSMPPVSGARRPRAGARRSRRPRPR